MKPKTAGNQTSAKKKVLPVYVETDTERTIRCMKLTRLYKAIHKDLLDQLERNCTTGQYYCNLAEDYMDMWIAKCLAVDDVRKRGISVPYQNGGGQSGMKKNDSVELQIKLNAQMLKLLAEMGIKPSQGEGGDDEL